MRLLVLFSDPAYLPANEVAEWIRVEACKLLDRLGEVESAELTPLRATGAYAHDGDWLLELRLPRDRTLDRVIAAPALREFVGDLRLLGTRPAVFVARDPVALTASA